MMNGIRVIAIVAALLVVSPVFAQKKSNRLGIGVSFGAFFPTDKRVIEATSSSTYSFGLSPTNIYYKDGLNSTFDVQILSNNLRGSKYFVLIPSYGYVKTFGDKDKVSGVKPFAALRVGPAYSDFSMVSGVNTKSRGKQLGFNANAELGVFMSETVRLSARYDVFSKTKQYKWDGLSLGLTWQFGRF
jgi:hypothetical protein